MPGLLSDDGYIFQRKVIIYWLLELLLNKDLAECQIELKCTLQGEEDATYSLDFFIKTNGGKSKFYEVKKKNFLYQKNQLKPIINDFYQLYTDYQPNDTEFVLVHACQIHGKYLEKLHSVGTGKNEAIKEMNEDCPDDFCERVVVKQMLDEIHPNLLNSDIDLRSIAMIDRILKEYNVNEYGAAEAVYHSFRACFENIESREAAKIKERVANQLNVGFPIEESVTIPLNDLLDHNNSFFDKISSRFLDRVSAINDFYAKFSIPDVAVAEVTS
jgi:hypothetical protein